MMRALLSLWLMVCCHSLMAQQTTFADLHTPKQVALNKFYTFPQSPKGYGTIQEFPVNSKRSEYFFEQERNTIWFVMEVPFSGMLTFEITPHNVKDDYDWMLFANTPELKTQLKSGTAKLLRSNNSRNDVSIKGKTGLKNGFANLFEEPGPNRSYSKPLKVAKGQKLTLIIDNIYNLGFGFDFGSELKPDVLTYTLLSGTVKDKATQLPLIAKIVCEDDSTGVNLAETTSSANGTYSLKIPADRPLNITATATNYLFQTADLKPAAKILEQNFNLTQITEIEKFPLFNIHFTPDKDIIRPNSEPELDRLINLLKGQKSWDVRIVGHTHNNPFADARYLQKLSFNRAIAVKKYLLQNGIAEKRISCTGVGGKSPIVMTKNAEEGLRNLRVEVVVSRR